MNQYLDSLSNIGQEYGNSAAQISSTDASNHLAGMFNEKTNQEIYKQGKHMLNGMIGESSAESALMLGHMGYTAYKSYKRGAAQGDAPLSQRIREAIAPPSAGDAGAEHVGLRPTVLDPTPHPAIEQPTFNIPARPRLPRSAESGVASGTNQPEMQTTPSQTDTPPMRLLGSGPTEDLQRAIAERALQRPNMIYDPSAPGNVKHYNEETGKYEARDSTGQASGPIAQQDYERESNKLEAYLQETSPTARARATRAGVDPDMPRPGEVPPLDPYLQRQQRLAEIGTPAERAGVDLTQRIRETPQEATVRRESEFKERMASMRPDKSGRLATDQPDIPMRPKYSRGAYTVEAGGRSGYNPLEAPGRPAAPMAAPQLTPLEPAVRAEPKATAVSTGTQPDEPSLTRPAPAVPATEAKEPVAPPRTEEDAPPTVAPTKPTVKAPEAPEAPDIPPEGGMGGMGELMMAGQSVAQLAGKGSAGSKLTGLGENVGMVAGMEAAESALPGLGEFLMAGTAIGSLISDLVEKSKDKAPAPPPTPAAPSMAFASASPLDSTAYRAPLGGIGQ